MSSNYSAKQNNYLQDHSILLKSQSSPFKLGNLENEKNSAVSLFKLFNMIVQHIICDQKKKILVRIISVLLSIEAILSIIRKVGWSSA